MEAIIRNYTSDLIHSFPLEMDKNIIKKMRMGAFSLAIYIISKKAKEMIYEPYYRGISLRNTFKIMRILEKSSNNLK